MGLGLGFGFGLGLGLGLGFGLGVREPLVSTENLKYCGLSSTLHRPGYIWLSSYAPIHSLGKPSGVPG